MLLIDQGVLSGGIQLLDAVTITGIFSYKTSEVATWAAGLCKLLDHLGHTRVFSGPNSMSPTGPDTAVVVTVTRVHPRAGILASCAKATT